MPKITKPNTPSPELNSTTSAFLECNNNDKYQVRPGTYKKSGYPGEETDEDPTREDIIGI